MIDELLTVTDDFYQMIENLEKAMELIDEYQMSNLDYFKDKNNVISKEIMVYKRTPKWKRYMGTNAALLNCCAYFVKQGENNTYYFDGFETDVEMAERMFDYFIKIGNHLYEKNNARSSRSEYLHRVADRINNYVQSVGL